MERHHKLLSIISPLSHGCMPWFRTLPMPKKCNTGRSTNTITPRLDIFDGSHYCSLLETPVTIDDEELPMWFFFDPRDIDCVACCPLTVHALLHIAPTIRTMGPVWAYWAFPMERYCGDIGRNIKSRRFPYATINKYITSQAQLTHVILLYGLHDQLSLCTPQSHDKDLQLPLCESFITMLTIQ